MKEVCKRIVIVLAAIAMFVWPVFALAGPNINQFTSNVAGGAGYDTAVTNTTLSQTIGLIVRGALSLIGTIFFAMTVYAGFLWMTAQGNGEQVEKATGIIRTGIIGLALTLAAYSITFFVTAYLLPLGLN